MKTILARLLAVVALCAVSASAQTMSKKEKAEEAKLRSMQGVVMDAKENLIEGAVVQLKDTRSLQVRSFITRADGAYHFHRLSREIDYEVKADHQGKASDVRRLSSFDGRSQAVMNLKIDK